MNLFYLIDSLIEENFWGQIIVSFQNGEPVVVERSQRIKLDKLTKRTSRNNRSTHAAAKGDHDLQDNQTTI